MEVKKETEIYVARTSKNVKIPEYKSPKAAGMDVRSIGRYVLFPQQKLVVNTGLVVAIESLSSLDVRPRSGLSLNTPLEISNAPGTIDADYRGEVGIIMKNSSLPSEMDLTRHRYMELWNLLRHFGKVNGVLSENDISLLRPYMEMHENIYTLDQEGNLPGIYIINPGDRIAQILMGDQTRIKWITEEFLTEDKINQSLNGYTKEQLEEMKEQIRTDHLVKVKSMGTDRGGGYGHSGVK